MRECRYMNGKNCSFEDEADPEDCIICMPHCIIVHTNMLLSSIRAMQIDFGHAMIIYTAVREIQEVEKGLLKLMEEKYPKAVERTRVPIIEPKGVV